MTTPTGAIPRDLETRLRDIERGLREAKTAAMSRPQLGVSAGDFVVAGGGSVIVEDGGSVAVSSAGNVYASYPSGAVAARFGPYQASGGELGYGFFLNTETGADLFGCVRYPASGSVFSVGPADYAFITANVVSISNLSGTKTIGLDDTGVQISHTTTAAAANCVINTNGLIQRSTSSRRYKQDIAPADVDVDAALALVPQVFRTKAEVHDLGDDAPTRVGFIAEDAADLGLDAWVKYDDEGPEAFDYATWCVALQAIVRQQQRQIAALTERVAALESAAEADTAEG